MSIQSNINQGISLMSLLASQSPMAEERRITKKIEAEKPLRDAELELAREKTKVKTEERLKLELEAENRKANEKLNNATGLHKQHAENIADIVRTKKGQINRNYKNQFEGHISSREAAIESGEALRKLAPTPELEANLGKWRSEIEELRSTQKDIAAKERERKKQERAEKSTTAAKREKARAAAEASAQAEAEAEVERLARSREITKMITDGVPLSRESQTYVNKKLGGNQ